MTDVAEPGEDALTEKQLAIEQQLRFCNLAELKKVAEGLNVEVNDDENGRSVFRKIAEVFDSVTPNEKEKFFYAILPLLSTPKIRQEVMRILMDEKQSLNVKRESEADRTVQDVSQVLKAMGFESGSATSTWRKECKISGVIGREGQKDRITYINLCSQIEDAKTRGYSSEEIAQAVRKAVSTGSELRTILDAKNDMPLDIVLTFVRGFLQEKTAEELYKDLNDMCQAENEDPQSFVLRAMGIRERIIKASESDSGPLVFDKGLVQGMFLQTVKTGLKDVAIKSAVRDVLSSKSSDPEILTALNEASLEEEQSKTKRVNANRRKAVVNKMQTSGSSDLDGENCAAGACVGGKSDDLAESVKMLVKEVSAMRKELDGMKGNRTTPNSKPPFQPPFQPPHNYNPTSNANQHNKKVYQKRGCRTCYDAGNTNSCRHCWNCGADDHFANHCPLPLNC